MLSFQQSRERLRRRIERSRLVNCLESARQDYIWDNNMAAYYGLLGVMEEVIVEPHPNSQEYKDGERKSATPDDEPQQEEVEFEKDVAPPKDSGPEPERDEDGYLIR